MVEIDLDGVILCYFLSSTGVSTLPEVMAYWMSSRTWV